MIDELRALVGATATEDLVAAIQTRIDGLIDSNNATLMRARKAEAEADRLRCDLAMAQDELALEIEHAKALTMSLWDARQANEKWSMAKERRHGEEKQHLRDQMGRDAHDAQLQRVVDDIISFQAETFPQATALGAAWHLKREAYELVDSLANKTEAGLAKSAEECADVVFLAIQTLTCLDRDLLPELQHKLAKNRRRTWGKPDQDGVVEHVRGQED